MSLLAPITLGQEAKTLRSAVTVRGFGIHTGAASAVTLSPHDQPGWWLQDRNTTIIPITAAKVAHTQQATTLALPSGWQWMTTEHVFSVLNGLWLDGVCVRLDREDAARVEMPAMDGSAKPLLDAIFSAGLVGFGHPQRALKLTRPQHVTFQNTELHLEPCDHRQIQYHVSYDLPLPEGAGDADWEDGEGGFALEIGGARTFAFKAWVDMLRSQGLIGGGSLACAVVFDGGQVFNAEGMRWPNEPARHKILDLLGDFALLGAPLLASVRVCKGGHGLHARALEVLCGDG
jgi:UDP-3-O-acyl N-acetylglucosamine deacetylase